MSKNENSVSPGTAVKFLLGVAVMCFIYPPMLGFVLGISGMLIFNYILYLFFLDINRTFRE